MNKTAIFIFIAFCSSILSAQNSQGIQIDPEHLQYWQYNGKAILLLGGSDDDNLFQMPGVKEQLDTLSLSGGNYVRCTMSSRDSGNVWPFYYDPKEKIYDLSKWDTVYWQRFSNFLHWTSERDIIVQIEVWATFDFYRDNWDKNPFNPINNRNYSQARTKLPDTIATHPIYTENPFFWSIPSQHNNMRLLDFQQKFVDKLLSYTLQYNHVLYCMDNETSVTSEWGKFWSTYIRKRGAEVGKNLHCTEMWDPWDLNHISHRESFDHPELYSFVEISQNNHHRGDAHWQGGLAQIERLRSARLLRPVNNIKIYGSDHGQHGGNDQDAMEKFCRNVLMGAASARFHRPTSGLGLNTLARHVIKSMRMLTDSANFFELQPLEVLEDREENEAYCRGQTSEEYLIYFTDGGEVSLPENGVWQWRWLDISRAEWKFIEIKSAKEEKLEIQCPGPGQWGLLLKKVE